jgi:hypothetical protein
MYTSAPVSENELRRRVTTEALCRPRPLAGTAIALYSSCRTPSRDDNLGRALGSTIEDQKRNKNRGDTLMKYRNYSLPFFSLLALLASGCTATKNAGVAVGEGTKEAAQQVTQVATDASVTAAVKMKMADDPDVAAMDINVDTTDGIVTLNGGREKKLKMTSVDAMYYD